ncbi:DUF6429 family protein [Pseudoalteromonas rubra]|uniref:DUF6429 domain-containing protein n=1 Tax=Pseudoalteromonas rubra TaxID=43658 RepID=A0A0U3HUR7_9GAMM|nr:DUF6429 family protein [Pseudoalteromonas rubra]ALU45225.1 hypothetical protein AT705_19890 [Pseudoalteromonas rubra]
MNIDEHKIDDAALAILSLTLSEDGCAWKQIDWEVMSRLYEKGLIHDPRGKQKSVQFTEQGVKLSRQLLEQLFTAEK